MEGKQIVGAVCSTIFRVIIAIAVIYFIYNVAIDSYNFGYRVFADVAMEVSPGTDVGVSIVAGKSPMEIGELLEEEGLVKDAKIFYVQELLSEYHGKLEPGVYVLNTSMSSEEMMAVMAQSETTSDEDSTEDSEEEAE